MPKRFIKAWLPDAKTIKEHRTLRIFGKLLHDTNLWHLNRYSVATAFSVGLFSCFMPIPFQMVLASALAIIFRANLPLSAALVWVTNPLTMPPIFYFAYKVGGYFTQAPASQQTLYFNWETVSHSFNNIWPPLIVGAIVCGLSAALLSNVLIRVMWRMMIVKKWHSRNG